MERWTRNYCLIFIFTYGIVFTVWYTVPYQKIDKFLYIGLLKDKNRGNRIEHRGDQLSLLQSNRIVFIQNVWRMYEKSCKCRVLSIQVSKQLMSPRRNDTEPVVWLCDQSLHASTVSPRRDLHLRLWEKVPPSARAHRLGQNAVTKPVAAAPCQQDTGRPWRHLLWHRWRHQTQGRSRRPLWRGPNERRWWTESLDGRNLKVSSYSYE